MTPRFLVVVAMSLGAAMTASAQDRPTVFMHGFGAEASDWAATADRLKARVDIEPHLPSLAWRERFADQAASLQSAHEFSTLPSSTVAVGHSNGGLVAREWSRSHPLDGVVTIGTPHGGAPILANLAAWIDFSTVTDGIVSDVIRAFSYSSDQWWVYFFVEASLQWLADFSLWSVVNLVAMVGANEHLPVAYEMVPHSAYLRSLNGSANLAREAAEIPNRVGIVSVAHNYYFAGPARAVAPDQADAIAAAMYSAAFGLMFWGNFILTNTPSSDLAGIDQALALIAAGDQILAIDPVYCALVSSLAVDQCSPNDGVVPVDNQAYPGAPNLLIGSENDGPAHRQEKQQSDDVLYAALVSYMHLPPAGGAGPAPEPPPPAPESEAPPAPESEPDDGPVADEEPPLADFADEVDPDDRDPVTIANGILMAGEELLPGDTVASPDGRYGFQYRSDGNLVLNDDNFVRLWESGTAGTRAGYVLVHYDGELAIYDPDGARLWSSGTYGYAGAWLAVQNDGDVVIYDDADNPIWRSGTREIESIFGQ